MLLMALMGKYRISVVIQLFNFLIFYFMNNFNKVFRDAEGTIFTKIGASEVAKFNGNYITVVDNKIVAVVDGNQVATPEVLYNEIGVEYHLVDFYAHGVKMAKKHGVYFAVKQEPIRVWKNVKPGEALRTVIVTRKPRVRRVVQ